jgi:hypothetical protein
MWSRVVRGRSLNLDVVLSGDVGEVHPFGEVLAQQVIEVLARVALPRRLRIDQVDLGSPLSR